MSLVVQNFYIDEELMMVQPHLKQKFSCSYCLSQITYGLDLETPCL